MSQLRRLSGTLVPDKVLTRLVENERMGYSRSGCRQDSVVTISQFLTYRDEGGSKSASEVAQRQLRSRFLDGRSKPSSWERLGDGYWY